MFPLLFGSIFLLTGLVPIWLSAKTFAKDRAIARWPRAPGTVTRAIIKSYTGTSRNQQGFSQSYTQHELLVEFTYTVDGCELQGNRLARAPMPSSTKPDLSRYPTGQAVMVYYDPNDPKTAYLEVHTSTGAVILTCFGGLFVGIGILVPTLVLSCGESV